MNELQAAIDELKALGNLDQRAKKLIANGEDAIANNSQAEAGQVLNNIREYIRTQGSTPPPIETPPPAIPPETPIPEVIVQLEEELKAKILDVPECPTKDVLDGVLKRYLSVPVPPEEQPTTEVPPEEQPTTEVPPEEQLASPGLGESDKLYQEIQSLEKGMVWTESKAGRVRNSEVVYYFDAGSELVPTSSGIPIAAKNPIQMPIASYIILPPNGKSITMWYSTEKYNRRQDPREDPNKAANANYIQKRALYSVGFPDRKKATDGTMKNYVNRPEVWSNGQYDQYAKNYIAALQKAKAEWDKPITWSDRRLKDDINDVLIERFHR